MANHTHIISKDSPAYQPCRLPPHATRAPLVGGNIYVLVGLEEIPVSAQGKGKEALRSHSLVARRLMYYFESVVLDMFWVFDSFYSKILELKSCFEKNTWHNSNLPLSLTL